MTVTIDENYDGLFTIDNFSYVWDGDLKISDNLEVKVPCLIVHGDMEVKGYHKSTGSEIIHGYQEIYDFQEIHGFQEIYGDQEIHRNQEIRRDQVIHYNQNIYGNQKIVISQRVDGFQTVGGSQFVFNTLTNFSEYLYLKPFSVYFTNRHIKIACKLKTVKEWVEITDYDIFKLGGDRALVFAERWGDFILAGHTSLVSKYGEC